MSKTKQSTLFNQHVKSDKKKSTSTFVNNMKLPIHRWFRYSAGFSAEWVADVTKNFDKSIHLFDPFVGSGTTVLAGELSGIESSGIEAHPFIFRVAKAKLMWDADLDDFYNLSNKILKTAKKMESSTPEYPQLIKKCYAKDSLSELHNLREVWLSNHDGSDISELTWLALVCILRKTSTAGTAPWQYVLPNRKKKNILNPFKAFSDQVNMMIDDMRFFQKHVKVRKGRIYGGDARNCSQIDDNSVDLILTSPPYPNNYDYADSTRLEMSFFGEIAGWGDLQNKVRKYLVRSCSQHMRTRTDDLDEILKEKKLKPILTELREVCYNLEEERHLHGGKKNYHLMVAAYFADLSKVWHALRRVCKDNSKVCFVVGDSAPYGIYVPVDKWLGELAISAGFKSYNFEKIRDRNIKWKNRKHRVPLHEGHLNIEG